jgi:signal transduction histidine kinase
MLDEVFPRTARSWKKRLQRVSMRTKIVVPMAALAIIPAMVVGIFSISRTRGSLKESTVQLIGFDAVSRAQEVQEFLQTVFKDLRFLAQSRVIRGLAAAEASGTTGRIAALRKEAEREFLLFSQGKRAYYQLRYLDSTGREVVRLNVENGQPSVVPLDKLQDKSTRYYVRAALELEPGEVYISPMDLNIERGKVEVPHREVVRYVTPVEGDGEGGRGLVVINVYADYLFSLISPFPPNTEAWLVGDDGVYLSYFGDSEEKRHLYRLEAQRRLSADYSPAEVSAILQDGRKQRALETASHLVFSAPIAFGEKASARRWWLLIAYPEAAISSRVRPLPVFLSVVLVLVVTAAAVTGVLVSYYLSRPMSLLRQATREVVAGNLWKQAEVATGGMIEGLASDFNIMTQRLREAHERLGTWDEELAAEVARQTERLSKLQSGLARADKLSSIGQMTAGVMHEIGNPLAALKTKIQVAQEDGKNCPDCRALLEETMKEVDRLSMFLRSFSRLAKLSHPNFQDVSLVDLVKEVALLVDSELRRRKVTLRLELAGDTPHVRGDGNQLRQLLINLLFNAADASSPDREILVRTGLGCESANIENPSAGAFLEIIDRGKGISPERLGKIWDPFFTTKPEGTGLGLAICRQIIDEHGGAIHVKSAPGAGTTVTVELPGRPAARTEDRPQA